MGQCGKSSRVRSLQCELGWGQWEGSKDAGMFLKEDTPGLGEGWNVARNEEELFNLLARVLN